MSCVSKFSANSCPSSLVPLAPGNPTSSPQQAFAHSISCSPPVFPLLPARRLGMEAAKHRGVKSPQDAAKWGWEKISKAFKWSPSFSRSVALSRLSKGLAGWGRMKSSWWKMSPEEGVNKANVSGEWSDFNLGMTRIRAPQGASGPSGPHGDSPQSLPFLSSSFLLLRPRSCYHPGFDLYPSIPLDACAHVEALRTDRKSVV